MQVKAVGHRVIVRQDPVETKTKSVIVLHVDEKRERAAAQKGTVLEVGPMAWQNEMIFGKNSQPWCKPGDRVFFARYAGKQINMAEGPEEDFITVLNDEDIQALITEE